MNETSDAHRSRRTARDAARRGRRTRRVVTAVTGGALLAAAVAVPVAGEAWPADPVDVGPAAVPVAATTVTQVCQGPPRLATALAGQDLGYDEFDPAGSGTRTGLDVVSLARDGAEPGVLTLHPSLGETAGEELSRTGEARLGHATMREAVRLAAEPQDDVVALASGTAVAVTESGDLRGLTATPCLAPAASAWIVGGSTEPGHSAQLVLSNAGATPATVTLTGWGSTGPLDLSAAGAVLVPPGEQRVVLLEALTADPRPVVHLEAGGGEVTAVVQDSRLRGLVPAGTDLLTPSVAPTETVVMPGVFVGETSGEGPDAPAVRIVNPGEDAVTAQVELLGQDGPVPVPGADALVVDPGAVAEVSLAGMPPGAWTAVVRGDGPLTAAAVSTSVGRAADDPQHPPVERAWAPATAGLSAGVAAVPAELVSGVSLVVANPADHSVTVEVVPVLADGTRGTAVTRTLDAGTSLREQVRELADQPVAAVEVRAPDGPVHAALALSAAAPDGTLLSVVPVTEDPHSARAVDVAPALRTLR
ncbi:DUF5719 family protein [uncultured Georgenia sp.]|uniref:DUF5719 family protein n=1 Tax=uncultured Georgenia sp. TaxID=378209 RepID=UPI002623B3BF|nr:DUF5719 family protein [uncultured Georgenia sp.]HLV05634.1 DUF5719 family protein [Actinomycetaceae bacterium]